ncbi:uroporphyrinogen-III C-methyltransferase [Lacisediminihabitans sp. FW035]
MDLNLDVSGRRVLLVGEPHASRRAIARYRAAGATVRLATGPSVTEEVRAQIGAADLVVLVGVAPALDRSISALATEHAVWLTRETAAATGPLGHVTLVGGGPGEEGLMTVAAMRALRAADIVYFDRLGPHDRLADWAPGAERVDVGKLPGHHAVPQAEVERMLVASALAGLTVVRLKGGDPFVFGRGGEEVLACREAGVPVSIISGVSSAIAAPGIAGIPVTHREVSRMFTVVSGHAPFTDEQLAHLVGLGSTIVVLMGIGTLPHLSAGLARHGMDASMPIAIIERAFSESQRTTIASIGTVVDSATRTGIRSPAVIVIGEVVRMAHRDDGQAAELLAQAARLVR